MTVKIRSLQYGIKRGVACFAVTIFFIGAIGCGNVAETYGTSNDIPFPDFSELLVNSTGVHVRDDSDDMLLPIKVFMDNTGSMAGFTVNPEGKREPSAAYVKMMRSLRDLGRLHGDSVSYYALDERSQDWVECSETIYRDFSSESFYVGWNSGQPGPLSKLYLGENKIDGNCVNIVITDLAEQNVNNTLLATEIQKLCEEEGCETVLFAFKFDFNGRTQVPNPNAAYGMLDEQVNGLKPYYLIITGPSQYTEKYVDDLKTLLEEAGLTEAQDYYCATSRLDVNYDTASISDVVFTPFVDYEEIKMEYDIEKYGAEAVLGEDGSIYEQPEIMKSKNLVAYDDMEQVFKGGDSVQAAAFRYELMQGLSSKMSDWRLNFYLPLSEGDNPDISYKLNWKVYKLTVSGEGESETDGDGGQADERQWVEDKNTRMELNVKLISEFEEKNARYPVAMYFSCQDKVVEKKHDPRETELLLVFRIEKEETIPYVRPEWLAEYDTGDTYDYFKRTYNLNGFYDVLFGYKNKRKMDDTIHISSTYAEIPIILTNLEQ